MDSTPKIVPRASYEEMCKAVCLETIYQHLVAKGYKKNRWAMMALGKRIVAQMALESRLK